MQIEFELFKEAENSYKSFCEDIKNEKELANKIMENTIGMFSIEKIGEAMDFCLESPISDWNAGLILEIEERGFLFRIQKL
jgi:hypothetical protein